MVIGVIDKSNDCVGANFRGGCCDTVIGKGDILGEVAGGSNHRRDFFCAVVGKAQVAELDCGITLGGGRGGEALLLPTARPALDLNRRGGELLGRQVGRDKEAGIPVSIKQLDVVDCPGPLLAVLGKFELHLVGSVCAVAADAVLCLNFFPEEFFTRRTN